VKTKLVQLVISLSGIKVSDVTGQVCYLHTYCSYLYHSVHFSVLLMYAVIVVEVVTAS